jgi:hypothetical protein
MSNYNIKYWLVFMAGSNSINDIKEMLDPIIDYFDGIVVTYHGDIKDLEYKYLDSVKKEGEIIIQPFCGRHYHSRNTYLWCGPIKNGDFCFTTDVLEHPNIEYVRNFKNIANSYLVKGINCVFFYSKPLFFQYHESMEYIGTPHESLKRNDGGAVYLDIANSAPEDSIRKNTRPLKRDKYHFIKHYCRYALYPWGSNHYMLGLDKTENPQQSFVSRETNRLKFIELLKELDIKRDVDSIIQYMKNGNMDNRFINFINIDKNFNDLYRYYVLNDTTIIDNHDWSSLVRI